MEQAAGLINTAAALHSISLESSEWGNTNWFYWQTATQVILRLGILGFLASSSCLHQTRWSEVKVCIRGQRKWLNQSQLPMPQHKYTRKPCAEPLLTSTSVYWPQHQSNSENRVWQNRRIFITIYIGILFTKQFWKHVQKFKLEQPFCWLKHQPQVAPSTLIPKNDRLKQVFVSWSPQ